MDGFLCVLRGSCKVWAHSVATVSRTVGGKFRNDEKYSAQKWWHLVEKCFSPEDPQWSRESLWAFLGTPGILHYLLVINCRVIIISNFRTFHVKIMKIGRKNIIRLGFYNNPGTLLGHSRDSLDSFHLLFVTYFPYLELNIYWFAEI